MRSFLRCAVYGTALFLTGAYALAVGSEVGHFRFLSDEVQSAAMVDRTHKSDKLAGQQASKQQSQPLTPQMGPATVETRPTPQPAPVNQEPPKILEGCEPAVSPLTAAATVSGFTGRCLAALTPSVQVADARS